MANFNVAKFKGTRRNSFSNLSNLVSESPNPSNINSNTELKPLLEKVKGNLNQIPITKEIEINNSNINLDLLNFLLNPNMNSLVNIKFNLLITFDNKQMNDQANQTRSIFIKSINDYLLCYNVNGNSTITNGSVGSTYLNPINGNRNILNVKIETKIEDNNFVMKLVSNCMGNGFLFINGYIDVLTNNSESIIAFS